MCLKATSDSPQQQQDDQNQEDQSDSTAGIRPPGLTVAPGGQDADEQEHQDDDQDDSHNIFLLSSFLKSRIPVNSGRYVPSGKGFRRLFHDQTILYRCDPVDAPCDLARFIDGLLRINETAQLNDALVSFDTDLE